MPYCQTVSDNLDNLHDLNFPCEKLHNLSRRNSQKHHLQHEKKARREIANSNERKRMQSINAGFQSLRCLLPLNEEDKLSKSSILQHAVDYIKRLVGESDRLRRENTMLLKVINLTEEQLTPKRRKRDTESSDEGVVLQGDIAELALSTSLTDIRTAKLRQTRSSSEPDTINESQNITEMRHQVAPPCDVNHVHTLNQTGATTEYRSNSQKNLEMILAAITHVEGPCVTQPETCCSRRGEESERESSSDREDCRSEMSSGYDSSISVRSLGAASLQAVIRPTLSLSLNSYQHRQTTASISQCPFGEVPT